MENELGEFVFFLDWNLYYLDEYMVVMYFVLIVKVYNILFLFINVMIYDLMSLMLFDILYKCCVYCFGRVCDVVWKIFVVIFDFIVDLICK